MNIYVKVELRNRDLAGRLLLAMCAAERGHRVVLGDLRALLAHRHWLAPGLFHDKSLTASASKAEFHRELVAAGFVVTSQDEEHGLGDVTYDAFARRRFSDATLGTSAAVFCWGPHDAGCLARTYPQHQDILHRTGSPRVDLWSPPFAAMHTERPLPLIDPARPYVLVAPGSRPFLPNSFWTAIADFRPRNFRSDDDEREWGHYAKYSEAYLYVGRLVRGLRLLLRAHPDLQIVVRPHPKSPAEAWTAVLGDDERFIVTKHGTSGAWMRRAAALIHNGSTTAAEAALMGLPVISFQPHGERSDRFTNRVGQVARDEDDLIRLVGERLTERGAEGRTTPANTRAVLAERLTLDGDGLAADRIVDVWDALDRPSLHRINHLGRAHALSRVHRRGGAVRSQFRRLIDQRALPRRTPRFDERPKFPPVAADELSALADGLRRSLGRFETVTVDRVDGRLFEITTR